MRRTAWRLRPGALVIVSLVALACTQASPTTQASPSAEAPQSPVVTQAPLDTQLPMETRSPAPSSSASATPSTVGLEGELIEPGELTMCSSFPRVRFAERDAEGDPFGADIEIGLAIAERLGLEPVIAELPFDEIIDAVLDGRCDVAISGHFITHERLQLIDLIPYREGRVSPVVRTGNPLGIDALTDLCGRTTAIVAGTIYHDIIRGLGEYAEEGVDQQCGQAGKPVVALAEYDTEADAVADLAAGDADAFIGNEAIVLDRPGEFELSAAELPRLRNGIGHRQGTTMLDDSIRSALRALIGDGTYTAILERYGVGSAALTEVP